VLVEGQIGRLQNIPIGRQKVPQLDRVHARLHQIHVPFERQVALLERHLNAPSLTRPILFVEDNNTRVLFERILSSNDLPKEGIEYELAWKKRCFLGHDSFFQLEKYGRNFWSSSVIAAI
jgi:hypothetical protein